MNCKGLVHYICLCNLWLHQKHFCIIQYAILCDGRFCFCKRGQLPVCLCKRC